MTPGSVLSRTGAASRCQHTRAARSHGGRRPGGPSSRPKGRRCWASLPARSRRQPSRARSTGPAAR
eukprot:3817266-Lingulodinium_polyedra.AAC.1